jgi:hypothetical protein
MTPLFVLLFFALFLGIDYFRSKRRVRVMYPGTEYATPGYEFLGALAQDGGKPVEKDHPDQPPKATVGPLKG